MNVISSRPPWSSRCIISSAGTASRRNTPGSTPSTAWARPFWSPLASGLLTGKHKTGPAEGTRATLKDYNWLRDQITREAKEKAAKIDQLGQIAKDLGLSMAVFAIAWCLKNPNVSTVILGASKVGQLTENLQAIEAQPKLTPNVMKTVDELVGW